jgi:adenylate kinase family enzyme
LKKEGKPLEDQMLIQLIQKRMAMKDCTSRGWILEDFPNTKS